MYQCLWRSIVAVWAKCYTANRIHGHSMHLTTVYRFRITYRFSCHSKSQQKAYHIWQRFSMKKLSDLGRNLDAGCIRLHYGGQVTQINTAFDFSHKDAKTQK
jgi:hypothetical protein